MNMGDVVKSTNAVKEIINPIDPLNTYVNFFDLWLVMEYCNVKITLYHWIL